MTMGRHRERGKPMREVSGETYPASTLSSASGTVRNEISVVQTTWSVAFCYGSANKLIQGGTWLQVRTRCVSGSTTHTSVILTKPLNLQSLFPTCKMEITQHPFHPVMMTVS